MERKNTVALSELDLSWSVLAVTYWTLNPYRYSVVSDITHRRIDNGWHLCLFPPGGLQSPSGRDRIAHRAPPVGSSQTTADGEGESAELWAADHVGAVQTAGRPRYGVVYSTCMLTRHFFGGGGGGAQEKERHLVRLLGLASKSEVQRIVINRGFKLRAAEFECVPGKLIPTPPPRLFLL